MRNKIKTAQLGAPWESWRFLNGRSIIPNRSAPQANATSKTNSQKTKRPRRLRIGQSHWGQWLYQHGRSIVPNRSAPEATATSKTNSQKPKDPAAYASRRAIGDNGSTMLNTPTLARRPIRKILRSLDQRASQRPTDFSFASDLLASS